ncbi:nucleoside phosphorylase [Christiangramia sabulilitoris]|uniref:Uridine phosphorylase n=1 Tax=Christiangramia sabulilitoris TaxID=2583991 RepID=A0A550I682_9FLAO|nr:nucleoside phosphorylase [Christiangramia sabulilitoris]TRO66461.1 phosphorylase [Christiangramia sabulilitoris]
MTLHASTLILNKDGSVYHLGLLPEDLANIVITVGDPDRVPLISEHFDNIKVRKHKREFCTHTGTYKGTRITVMSTGMGTDNIDIALTELDLLVNIDLKAKKEKKEQKSLNIVRIGTTGSLHKSIPTGSFVLSEMALGFDGLMYYYKSDDILETDIAEAFVRQTDWSPKKATPYVVKGGENILKKLRSAKTIPGFTGTNIGFYGPQGRVLRLELPDPELNDKIAAFKHNDLFITNLEMETSGIYGMSKLLGHNAASINLVVANRATGEFAENADVLMNEMIIYTLDKLVS